MQLADIGSEYFVCWW